MFDDLNDLYQQVILDHSKSPRNYFKLDVANRVAEGRNPLCGDHVTVYVTLNNDHIGEVAFEGAGCAICTASASMMTDALKGKTFDEANALFDRFHGLVTAPASANVDTDALGKLAVLAGVREYPMRVKCASLAWHTLKAAMQAEHDVVSTE